MSMLYSIQLVLFLSVSAYKPGFISPLENITVAAGRLAQFTCVVKHLGGHKVIQSSPLTVTPSGHGKSVTHCNQIVTVTRGSLVTN